MLWQVAGYALITAVATGLGALPFFWTNHVHKRQLGRYNSLAAGLMVGASIVLLYEGLVDSLLLVASGVILGVLFVIITGYLLKEVEIADPNYFTKASFRQMVLIIVVMTAHSFAEGISIGFSFGGSMEFGLLIVLAMAIQNVPEGLAVGAVLCPRGISPTRAAWWSIFTSLPQPLMAVPAFLFVKSFAHFLPLGLGFAGGAMIWVVFAELVPETRREVSLAGWLPVFLVSIFAMMALGLLIK